MNFPIEDNHEFGIITDISIGDDGFSITCSNGSVNGHGYSSCCDYWENIDGHIDQYHEIHNELFSSACKQLKFIDSLQSVECMIGESLVSFGLINYDHTITSDSKDTTKNKRDTIFIMTTPTKVYTTCYRYDSLGNYSGSFTITTEHECDDDSRDDSVGNYSESVTITTEHEGHDESKNDGPNDSISVDDHSKDDSFQNVENNWHNKSMVLDEVECESIENDSMNIKTCIDFSDIHFIEIKYRSIVLTILSIVITFAIFSMVFY